MFVACRVGDVSIVNMLLGRNANPTTRNVSGWTPLHSACMIGSLPIARELIHRGADAYAPNRGGVTPLQLAQLEASRPSRGILARKPFEELVHYILEVVGRTREADEANPAAVGMGGRSKRASMAASKAAKLQQAAAIAAADAEAKGLSKAEIEAAAQAVYDADEDGEKQAKANAKKERKRKKKKEKKGKESEEAEVEAEAEAPTDAAPTIEIPRDGDVPQAKHAQRTDAEDNPAPAREASMGVDSQSHSGVRGPAALPARTSVKAEFEVAEGLRWSESWIHGEVIDMVQHDKDAKRKTSSKMPTKLKKKVSMWKGGDETIQ